VGLAVLDGGVYELGIFGFLGGGEDKGGVRGGILRLVFANGWVVLVLFAGNSIETV